MQITKLKQERLNRQWTLKYVAECTGTTKQTIQRIENLKRKPSYDLLVNLQELFNLYRCDLLALVDNDKEPFSSKNNY